MKWLAMPARTTTDFCQNGFPGRSALVLGGDLLERVHPDDADVAPERDRLDPVLGLAPGGRPQPRPEPEEGFGGLHAEVLGGHEVTTFVDDDHQNDADDHDGGAHDLLSRGRRERYSVGTVRRMSAARPPCLRIGVEDVLHRPGDPVRHRIERLRHHRGDAGEADPAVEECRHGDLVGGVEHRRCDAAPAPGGVAEVEAGERLRSGASKVSVRWLRSSAGVAAGRRSGCGEGVLDGYPHVGLADLRLDAAVDELDHRVDNALRVHHDVDVVVGDPEHVVRLDHLERLVHHRWPSRS